MSVTSPLSPTERSTLRRHRECARTERAKLYAILDEALICHFGVIIDGAPVVLPTCFGRLGDTLYLHGSTAARSIATASAGPTCVTVTLLDGLVYARSVMHHSANYRSAVVHGTARALTGPEERLAALEAIVEHTTPGSWAHARTPTRRELAATAVLALELTEAAVKMRGGPPVDDEEDVRTGLAWAGVVPVRTSFGRPEPCPLLQKDTLVPEHVQTRLRRSPVERAGRR